jgi:CDGSH-type Zn-finger protein
MRVNMTKPIVADNKPKKVALSEGENYFFCSCGRSAKQPFCDGSHKGSGFQPKAFTAEKSGDFFLCACKHSANTPFCDGTHKQFSSDDVGK